MVLKSPARVKTVLALKIPTQLKKILNLKGQSMNPTLQPTLLATLHNAQAQTQQQITMQQASEQTALDEQKQHFQQSLKNVENAITSGMQQLVNLLSVCQTQGQALNDSNLEQHQIWLDQTQQKLLSANQALAQTQQQIQQNLTELDTSLSDQQQQTIKKIEKSGEKLRQVMDKEEQKTIEHSKKSYLSIRAKSNEVHQETCETLTQNSIEMNQRIKMFSYEKMPITASMGFLSGMMFTVLMVLSLLIFTSYQTWQQINHNADMRQEQLQILDSKINKTPAEQKLLTMVQVNELGKGQGTVISFKPNTQHNLTNINGQPQLAVWQDTIPTK
ncbi:hypothetical protein A9306_03740 [Moraxella atlantae]|uniref:Uncharacterized protein n=1 Tax=Faucicola atlantae TaxID=34059 RepID=A0A1B8QKW0_9GAMM|nr:hypothetical protein A9306_03740 [Moraxella atlantae]